MFAVVQKWEETERGWGSRPDGYTLHKNEEDIEIFLKGMRDREAEAGYSAQNVPDEYTRPCGKPYWTRIDDEALAEKVAESECGIWGPGGNNSPTPVAKGSDQSGWVSLKNTGESEQ